MKNFVKNIGHVVLAVAVMALLLFLGLKAFILLANLFFGLFGI